MITNLPHKNNINNKNNRGRKKKQEKNGYKPREPMATCPGRTTPLSACSHLLELVFGSLPIQIMDDFDLICCIHCDSVQRVLPSMDLNLIHEPKNTIQLIILSFVIIVFFAIKCRKKLICGQMYDYIFHSLSNGNEMSQYLSKHSSDILKLMSFP